MSQGTLLVRSRSNSSISSKKNCKTHDFEMQDVENTNICVQMYGVNVKSTVMKYLYFVASANRTLHCSKLYSIILEFSFR